VSESQNVSALTDEDHTAEDLDEDHMPALRRGRDDASAAHAQRPALASTQTFRHSVLREPYPILSRSARNGRSGPAESADLNWRPHWIGDLLIVRLPVRTANLPDCSVFPEGRRPLAAEDRELLEAIAGHAAMALETPACLLASNRLIGIGWKSLTP